MFEDGTDFNPMPDKPAQPDDETLMEWLEDGAAEATDGCIVELDGTCSHGKPSWLLILGMI